MCVPVCVDCVCVCVCACVHGLCVCVSKGMDVCVYAHVLVCV